MPAPLGARLNAIVESSIVATVSEVGAGDVSPPPLSLSASDREIGVDQAVGDRERGRALRRDSAAALRAAVGQPDAPQRQPGAEVREHVAADPLRARVAIPRW